MPPPDPVEAIRYAMESRGLTSDDLVFVLGNRQHVKAILGRKRSLTLAMVRRLHTALGISADVLIQPFPVKAAACNAHPQREPEKLRSLDFHFQEVNNRFKKLGL